MGFHDPVTTLAGPISVGGQVAAVNAVQLLADTTIATGVIDVGAYSSLIVVTTSLPAAGKYAIAQPFFGSWSGDLQAIGGAACWDASTAHGLWIFDVRGRYVRLDASLGTGQLGFQLYGSPTHLEADYVDTVGAAQLTNRASVTVASIAGAGYSPLTPFSARGGLARIFLRGLGSQANNVGWVQPRRLALDPQNAIWIALNSTNGDWTDTFIAPHEPLAIAYYSTAAHGSMLVNFAYEGR